jgi:hypothetical protein
LLNELTCRRSSFRQGRRIRLADGQTWTFPAPPQGSEWKSLPFGAEYTDILQALQESEDSAEENLAKLALSIFLLGHNYHLSPVDYERLLGSTPASPDSSELQNAFQYLAQEHLHSYVDASGDALVDRRLLPAQGRFSRVLAWLRTRLPSRWSSFDSRSA